MADSAQAIARVNGTVPEISVAAGRKGFKAELDGLRERMYGLGFGYDEIAAELSRRYRLRPREAYRLAYGWSLGHAAERFNALTAQENADSQSNASMTGPHLCEYEKWPDSMRKPSVYLLCMLAKTYDTDVLSLLDLADHESLPQRDRLVLMRGPRPKAETPFGEKLVSLMDARGLSQRKIARMVPCDNGHVSKIIRGKTPVSERLAGRLDEVLNAGGELLSLAERTTREVQRLRRDSFAANKDGLVLSLPSVPRRLVIEITGPDEQRETEVWPDEEHDAM
jgi:transcriptional regulator with XRE-family HTH domain